MAQIDRIGNFIVHDDGRIEKTAQYVPFEQSIAYLLGSAKDKNARDVLMKKRRQRFSEVVLAYEKQHRHHQIEKVKAHLCALEATHQR